MRYLAIGILNLKKLNYLIYKRRKILKILKKELIVKQNFVGLIIRLKDRHPSLFQSYLMKKIQKLQKKSLHLN